MFECKQNSERGQRIGVKVDPWLKQTFGKV